MRVNYAAVNVDTVDISGSGNTRTLATSSSANISSPTTASIWMAERNTRPTCPGTAGTRSRWTAKACTPEPGDRRHLDDGREHGERGERSGDLLLDRQRRGSHHGGVRDPGAGVRGRLGDHAERRHRVPPAPGTRTFLLGSGASTEVSATRSRGRTTGRRERVLVTAGSDSVTDWASPGRTSST